MKTQSGLHQKNRKRTRSGITDLNALKIIFFLLMLFILTSKSASSQQAIDLFEPVFNWHSLGWGNASTIGSTTEWKTEGNSSLKMYNTTTGDQWTAYECDPQNSTTPTDIVMDIKNASNFAYDFTVQAIDINGNVTSLGSKYVDANAEYINCSFKNTAGSFCKIRLLQEHYGTTETAITYVDNIRMVNDGKWFNWHSLGWGNISKIEHSHDWNSQGNYSLKMYNTTTSDSWTAYECDVPDNFSPSQIIFDIKNGSAINYDLTIQAVYSNGTYVQIDQKPVTSNMTGTFTINNTAGTFSKLRLVQEHYVVGQVAVTFIDNIRIVNSGQTSLWCNCESPLIWCVGEQEITDYHYNWVGIGDAQYVSGITDSSCYYSGSIVSPEAGSNSSIIMEWDSSVSTGTYAEMAAFANFPDISGYNEFKLDVYSPSAINSDVEMQIWIFNQHIPHGHLSRIVKIPAIDSWTTITIPMVGMTTDRKDLTEIKIVIPNTTAYKNNNYGRLYFDNLRVNRTIPTVTPLAGENMDNPSIWKTAAADTSSLNLSSFPGNNNDGMIYDYNLNGGWVTMRTEANFDPKVNPISFYLKPYYDGQLEMKFIDTDGSIFQKVISLRTYNDWMHVVAYLDNMNYTYGGDSIFGTMDSVEFGFAGGSRSSIWFDEIGYASAGTASSFGPEMDPDSSMSGIGDLQRRAIAMTEKDPLVLEYLKQLQDYDFATNTGTGLIRSMEGEDLAHTFNNAVVAMAFLLEGEKVRAEKILDFYSNATDKYNTDIRKQNFYYYNNGVSEKRGFYQQVKLSTLRDEDTTNNRWMGDMAWLLCAYKFYERQYSSDRYVVITNLLLERLRSLYVDASYGGYTVGGYVLTGWRYGDMYAPGESGGTNDPVSPTYGRDGHHEGNIDAWAAMKLCGVGIDTLNNIEGWIENELTSIREDKDLPLDLYTWRSLAMGAEDSGTVALLNIPEYDFRYRKTIDFNGNSVTGLYSEPDNFVNNIWSDGFGHIICAYLSYGDRQRGYFYANELDKLMVTNVINGITTHAIPYAANSTGKFTDFDATKGFSSSSAWYIFAKNCFNPFSTFSIYMDVPYVQRENNNYSDAACAKMILDYEGTNSYTQTSLHNYGIGAGVNYRSGLNYFDPYGMYRTLNKKELDPDLNYAQITRSSQTYAYRDLCYWLSHDINNSPRVHMPSVVPIGGVFTDWIVINGFQSSVNPQLSSAYTVYGFYVKDPKVNGIGQDMYIQASVFGSNYFLPISSAMPGIWDNKYVTVNEPPENSGTLSVQPVRPASQAPVDNSARFLAAEQGLKQYQLMNDKNISNAMNGATRGRIYSVDLSDTASNYYIVTYEKDGGVIASVTIKATNGALKEVTYLSSPDTGYYNNIPGTRVYKSFMQESRKILNPFYPDASTVKLESDGTIIMNEMATTANNEYMNKEELFRIFPNPANNYVRLDYLLNQQTEVGITIYDLSGNVCKVIPDNLRNVGSYKEGIDISELSEGIYYVQFSVKNAVQMEKLVILR